MDGDDQGLQDGPQPVGDGGGHERRTGQEGAEEHLEIVSWTEMKIDCSTSFLRVLSLVEFCFLLAGIRVKAAGESHLFRIDTRQLTICRV